MALPREFEDVVTDLASVDTELTAVSTSIAALPPTPLEADLPNIVSIINALNTAAQNLRTTLDTTVNLIRTVRINQ